MSEKFITVKEVVLKNNCPECFSKDGLRLAFKQKFLETLLYTSVTKKINYNIACEICNTTIYPVQWTDDIERVFEYHQKVFVPKKASTALKKLSWFAILVIVTISIAALFLVLQY